MTITHNTPEPLASAPEILTDEALAFLEVLHEKFGGRREELLAARVTAREKVMSEKTMDFLPETQEIRDGDWTVSVIHV